MKKRTFKTAILFQTAFIVTGILLAVACDTSQNVEDTKEIAEEQNEERFENNDKEDDAQFLVDVAEINMEEIKLGELAQKKGTTTKIKELGKMMVDAHTQSQKELSALAKTKSIIIPTTATQKANDAYKKLNEESGDDFNKAYADQMVSGHKDAIETYEEASKDSHDRDIKNWAISSLPGLRKHLDHSIDCQKKYADMYFNLNKQ